MSFPINPNILGRCAANIPTDPAIDIDTIDLRVRKSRGNWKKQNVVIVRCVERPDLGEMAVKDLAAALGCSVVSIYSAMGGNRMIRGMRIEKVKHEGSEA